MVTRMAEIANLHRHAITVERSGGIRAPISEPASPPVTARIPPLRAASGAQKWTVNSCSGA
jgi:hypothetical protein